MISNGDLLVGGKFRVVKKIGSGSFGEIHMGTNVTSKKAVAIKFESPTDRFQQLLTEKSSQLSGAIASCLTRCK